MNNIAQNNRNYNIRPGIRRLRKRRKLNIFNEICAILFFGLSAGVVVAYCLMAFVGGLTNGTSLTFNAYCTAISCGVCMVIATIISITDELRRR